jgi:hypothetical protein
MTQCSAHVKKHTCLAGLLIVICKFALLASVQNLKEGDVLPGRLNE